MELCVWRKKKHCYLQAGSPWTNSKKKIALIHYVATVHPIIYWCRANTKWCTNFSCLLCSTYLSPHISNVFTSAYYLQCWQVYQKARDPDVQHSFTLLFLLFYTVQDFRNHEKDRRAFPESHAFMNTWHDVNSVSNIFTKDGQSIVKKAQSLWTGWSNVTTVAKNFNNKGIASSNIGVFTQLHRKQETMIFFPITKNIYTQTSLQQSHICHGNNFVIS